MMVSCSETVFQLFSFDVHVSFFEKQGKTLQFWKNYSVEENYSVQPIAQIKYKTFPAFYYSVKKLEIITSLVNVQLILSQSTWTL